MAKFKKSAGKKKSKHAADESAQAQAERLSKSLSESAQQIWLAGVGALGRAQAEGTRLFEGLAKDGLNLEQTARKFAGNRAEVVRDSVESTVGQARERAADTWDRLEKVFEDRVQRALIKLGVPNRDDLRDLSRRVDTLTAELRRQDGAGTRATTPPARKATRKTTAAKSVSGSRSTVSGASPVRKTPARPAAPRGSKSAGKQAAKAAEKKTTRRSLAPTRTPVAP